MMWNGWNVDIYGPAQTLRPGWSANYQKAIYNGDDPSGYIIYGDVDIPLDIRYASFKARLQSKLIITDKTLSGEGV